MKKVEADRLLNLHGTALRAFFSDITHPDIAAPPEIVQVLLLGCEQLLEPTGRNPVPQVNIVIRPSGLPNWMPSSREASNSSHSPLGAAAEVFGRRRLRRVINHVFGEIDRTAGPGVDCEGDLAEILGVGNLVGVRARGL